MGSIITIAKLLTVTASTFVATVTNAQSTVDPDASTANRAAQATTTTGLKAGHVFALADEARARRDYATAEAAYRALSQDRDLEVRTEARFRLGMMLADDLKRYSDAAIEFRHILNEKPGAARVRLELARIQATLGNYDAARKELRAVQAAGLPRAVEQLVRFYSRALNARKPFGGSIEVSLAPDSNINRATRSDTLGTVIGDFILDDNARAKSGVGLDLRGQSYVRVGMRPGTDMLVRASTGAKFYRESEFNDVTIGLQAGPQINWSDNQLTLSLGPVWRWYGRDPYSTAIGGNATWQRPSGKRSQLRLEGGIARIDNQRNALQDATDYTLSASLDRAFSARFGGGVQVFGFRETARDPAYSLTNGGIAAYLFRELGSTTLVGTVSYGRTEADERLFLYPERRKEDRYSASLAATLRALRLGSFAPLVRLKWERNRANIEIYDYRRIVAEFGVTSAF